MSLRQYPPLGAIFAVFGRSSFIFFVEEREESIDVEEREKERERGSNGDFFVGKLVKSNKKKMTPLFAHVQ